MARLNQDILPAVQEAQRAFGRDPRGLEPGVLRADETPPMGEASPYLEQFPEDPELAASGMPDESPLTEGDMYQE